MAVGPKNACRHVAMRLLIPGCLLIRQGVLKQGGLNAARSFRDSLGERTWAGEMNKQRTGVCTSDTPARVALYAASMLQALDICRPCSPSAAERLLVSRLEKSLVTITVNMA